MTTHCTPPPHIYITYRKFGSTGPRPNKRVEILGPVYLHSSLLLFGPNISMCMCVVVCVCVCVCVCERERKRESVRLCKCKFCVSAPAVEAL